MSETTNYVVTRLKNGKRSKHIAWNIPTDDMEAMYRSLLLNQNISQDQIVKIQIMVEK